MDMVISQYEVYMINLDPSIGHEIQKTRPCVVLSPNEMNYNINTVIIAPMTTQSHAYPTRLPVRFLGRETWVILDQIRTVDNIRFVKRVGKMKSGDISKIKKVLREMLVD